MTRHLNSLKMNGAGFRRRRPIYSKRSIRDHPGSIGSVFGLRHAPNAGLRSTFGPHTPRLPSQILPSGDLPHFQLSKTNDRSPGITLDTPISIFIYSMPGTWISAGLPGKGRTLLAQWPAAVFYRDGDHFMCPQKTMRRPISIESNDR